MTSPVPRGPAEPVSTTARERRKLAKRWARRLTEVAFVPVTHAELEQHLLGLVDELHDLVTGASCGPDNDVAARLVGLNCTGATILQVTVEVLGKGLLQLAGAQHTERVIGLLSFLASDYAERMRLSAMDQQDVLRQSVVRAMHNAQRSQRVSENRFDQLVRTSSSGLAITDSLGRFVRANEALQTIVGRTATELVQTTVFDLAHPDDVSPLRADYRALSGSGVGRSREWRRLVRGDGETAWVSMTLSLLEDPAGQGDVMVVVEDGTELHLLQGQLNRHLLHDELTWLPNRQFFTTWLEKTLRTADPATGVTLYHLDLAAFSVINRGLGRRAGDEVLRTVAHRLKGVVADENAMVARFGGDEFAILVENSPGTPDAAAMVRRINEVLAEPVEADGHLVAVSAAIGVVDRPAHHTAPADLLDLANRTLCRAKGHGWRQWEVSEPVRDASERVTFSLAATMPQAWRSGELQVLYRPLVRLCDEQVAGAEALLSWNHPELGHIPHDECLWLADRTDLVVPLGRWLLRSACEQVATWQRSCDRDIVVRVSLTPSQAADPELAGELRHVLRETGLRPQCVRLGFPLEALSAEQGPAVENLKRLAGAAFGVEMDDAGMGSACLLRVAELPVQAVKIARAVAKWAPLRPEEDLWAARALKNLLALLDDAAIAVIVDGVETTAQAEWWRAAGAELVSGELFADAQPPDDIALMLTRDA